MATLITFGTSTITPTQVIGYDSSRETQSIVHPIIGKSGPDGTLRPAMLRNGTLRLGFAGTNAETNSKTAEDLACGVAAGQLTSTELSTIAMSFIVAGGSVTRELESSTRAAWIVTIPFQEISTS